MAAHAQASELPTTSHSRSRDALECGVAFTLLEIALWSPKAPQLWWGVAMLAVVALGTLLGHRGIDELGLGTRGFRESLIVLWMGAAVAGVLLLVGWAAGWLHYLTSSVAALRGTGYMIWAFEQQFMAQSFYFVRFESIFGSRRAVWITATLFSIAHLPNPVLVPATFLAELGFSAAFRCYRNLYPIFVAHALLGLALSAALPMSWTHQMRVGLGYLLLHR